LTHSRAAHTESLGSRAKPFRFGHGDEHSDAVEVIGHLKAELTSA
jgi:hypothetical protein